MPRPKKLFKLDTLTSDYMDAASELFMKDDDAEAAMEYIELSADDKKWLAESDLDSLSKLLIASILGY